MPIWVIESMGAGHDGHVTAVRGVLHGAMALAGVGQRPVSVRTLNLDWRETDGPLVASPTHRGFGFSLHRLVVRAVFLAGRALMRLCDR